MTIGLLGKKIGMIQIFLDKGEAVPVTVIQVGPCTVTQVKTIKSDAYAAVQLGFKEKKEKHVKKAERGHFKKAGVKPKSVLCEFRVNDGETENYKPGLELKVDVFSAEDKVDIAGVSKGRGFAGVMKRHHFKGTRSSHGQGGEYHRHAGSIGQCSFPARVFKGMKMPGHLGVARVTTQNVQVVRVDVDKNLLIVRGAVPGANGGLVVVLPAVKAVRKELKNNK